MAELFRSLTHLFHWGTPTTEPGVTHGPETTVAKRLRTLMESCTPAAGDGEALRLVLLPSLKQFIAEERGRIESIHRRGASGLEVVGLHTELVDAVICQLFRLADTALPPNARQRTPGCAVVARGGFGRRELNPNSDVDVMFLYPRQVDEYVSAVLNHVLYFLWDLGFSVGHSCRSLADVQRMMDADR